MKFECGNLVKKDAILTFFGTALLAIFESVKFYEMKNLFITLFTVVVTSIGYAQSLELVEKDTVLSVNSTAVTDYGFSIDVRNNSTTSEDVYVRRAYHMMNCAYDSGYFCWDFCYGADIDNSVGSVTFQPGAVRTDFSGHVYSPTTGNTCLDSTRYVFYTGKNPNDSLSVWVTISAGPTVGTVEVNVREHKMYPNPASDVLFVDLEQPGTLRVINALGAEVRNLQLESGKQSVPVADLPSGVYLYSINGATFKRITISH